MKSILSARSWVLLAGLASACAPIPRPSPQPPEPPRPAPQRTERSDFDLTGARTQGGLLFGSVPRTTVALTLDGRPVPFASDGHFVIGFARNAESSATVEARLKDGSRLQQIIAIAPRQWDIQSLPTLPKGTKPTPEFLARRKGELEQIGAARAFDSGSNGWRQHFVWPVEGRISGVFGSQRIYAGEPGEPHSGVDIARPAGTPIAAPADGVVTLAALDQPFSLEGHLLMIDHGMGVNSAFLHLSRIDVKVGDHVKRGQIIGAIGMTGRATGPHLHWAIKWRDVRVDPALLVGPMPGLAGKMPVSGASD